MSFFLKTSVCVVLFLTIGWVKAEETASTADLTKETSLPIPLPEESSSVVSLEEAIKKAMLDSKNKILAAKTEMIAGKKTHVIKILTATGHIQYIKTDAANGKILDKLPK